MNIFDLLKAIIMSFINNIFGSIISKPPPSSSSINISCPDIAGTFTSFTVTGTQIPYQITIQIPSISSSQNNYLCTLSLEQQDDNNNEDDNTYIPIARTYDGNDWECAGGQYVSTWDDWICNNNNNECTTSLYAKGTYYLRNRIIPSEKNTKITKVAQFLEQATFGITKTLLDNTGTIQQSDDDDFQRKYIYEQIYNVPATYHRIHFRQRMNSRAVFHQPSFAATVDPCSQSYHSTWRRRMLSEKDIRQMIKFNKIIINGITWWHVFVNGQSRGYTTQVRFNENVTVPATVTIESDIEYQFCTTTVDEIRKNQIHLRINNKCIQMNTDDFIIQFPSSTITPSSNNVLSGKLASLNDNNTWKSLSNYIPDYLYIGYIDTNLCNDMNIPNNYNEITSPIFAQTIDGQWLIHEPRFILRDNTVENPIIDGGLSDWKEGRTRTCANVPRSYQNEHGCKVSTTVPACKYNMKDPSEATIGTLVCGSPGEVSNNIIQYGDTWLDIQSVSFQDKDIIGLPSDTTHYLITERQDEYIWTDIVLYSNDQLRQRTAWILSQIFSLQKSVRDGEFHTELFVQYYDIFVKHAFSNYLNILRDIVYSPLMGISLSYEASKSIAVNFQDTNGEYVYPDENFAREIMQLFTIGLIELNINGTPILDSNTGKTIPTYDNNDIMSMARIWTGFVYRWGARANNERTIAESKLDPLQIIAYNRDRFPKTNLYNGYIGDGYPLCIDLPKHHFLKKGAKYRILGTSPAPEAIYDNKHWSNRIDIKRIILDFNSELYQKLCVPNNGGQCTYPSVVVLDTNLNCYDDECNVDTIRTINVNGIYYEYIHIPCVQQVYYNNPIQVSMNGIQPACVPSKLQVAGTACCDVNRPAATVPTAATVQCMYAGERVSYVTAEQRCQFIGKELCEYTNTRATSDCPNTYYHWMSNDSQCQLQVKVNEAGYGAVVHYIDENTSPSTFVQENTPSYFKLYWENDDDQYPNPLNGGCPTSCKVTTDNDNACLCNVSVIDEIVFTTLPDNSNDIINKLYIGHAPPDLYDTGTFTSNSYSDYVYYSQDGGDTCCNTDTVFEIIDHTGMKIYYKNIKSTVHVDGTGYKFRNPVHFNSFLPYEFTIMDAEHETEAVLQHLFRHKNTAPFVSYRFIQRFGNSNPSPNYVQVVAEAFRDGTYQDGDMTFGSGEYGDLAATVAAVLLYQEARSVSLTEDPTHGSLREPIIKVIAAMRALEVKPTTPLVELHMMESRIGQMAHEQPSVFSFFHPEFSPPGPAGSAALTAPEAEVMSSAQVVGLLNGLFSMVMNGIDNCGYGFGATPCSTGPTAFITYQPNYASSEAMMEDLSILLTSGRLQKDKQDKIISALINETDNEKQFNLAVQLVMTSPEFHTTNSVDPQSELESPVVEYSDAVPLDPGYKAVVHIFLNGGCDSFNVLTPHPSCTKLSTEYKEARGYLALMDEELLPISATGQPCTTFGLHNAHAFIKELYDDGDALFVANAGVMTRPVDKTNYQALTQTQLFAHNAMSDEVKRLDPFNTAIGTGVFGRALDSLEAKGYTTGRTSIEANTLNLASRSPIVPSVVTVDALVGVDPLNLDPPSLGSFVSSLNGGFVGGNKEVSGIYGETWSKILRESRNQTDELYQLLTDNPTETPFPNTLIAKRLQVVAQLIATHEARGVDRDAFFVSMDGYDAHSGLTNSLNINLRQVDDAVRAFVTEMKLMGLWENVVIIQTSEFGRTLTPNNGGTDHGWGGNYWIAGGDVKGGQILGQYPSSLSTTGYQIDIMDRGRLIPTTPMDSIFNAVTKWIGLDDDDELEKALPNRAAFTNLFQESDLFHCTGYC